MDTTVDGVDGDFSAGNLSFREVILFANSNPGADTVRFADSLANQTIPLTLGEIQITDDLAIVGLGADRLEIAGNHSFRLFHVDVRPRLLNFSISDLTIRDGGHSDVRGGGAIYSVGNVTLERTAFLNNRAFEGGAVIDHHFGELKLIDSTFAGNIAPTGSGVVNSDRTSLTVVNSTFVHNTGRDGAIGAHSNAVIRNSTIAFNTDSGIDTTVGQNIVVHNTLIVGNTTGDIVGNVSLSSLSSNNLIGTPAAAGGLMDGVNGNQVGESGLPIDGTTVVSDQLGNHGGPTPTLPLLPQSLALNAGNNSESLDANGQSLGADQRGLPFSRIVGSAVDIGAFESVAISGAPDDLIVFDPSQGRWRVGLNQGGNLQWIDGPQWDSSLGWQTFVGDVNGDGTLDGIGFSSSNAIFVALNDGQGHLLTVSAGSFGSTSTFQFPMVGDFDGNGTTDFLAQLSSGEWFSKRWNGFQFETTFYGRWTPQGWTGFRAGDFNGDGIDDIVGLRDSVDETRSIWMYGLSNLVPVGRRFAGIFAGRFGSSFAQSGWHNFLVGDYNGDGKDDVLSQMNDGQFWYTISNGSPISQPNLGANRFSISPAARFSPTSFSGPFSVGDFNADGLDDIVSRLHRPGYPNHNQIWVGTTSFSDRAAMSASRWGVWGASITWGAEIVGDYNGDGFDDLAGLDIGRQLTFVSLTSGNRFERTVGFGSIQGAALLVDPETFSSGKLKI
ncbi:MAG: VCBS repeat-containing protein [Planctomycetaceae bacterium]|nr:VCBS repeat-containing protein [Planctomycetaceae bacterium]